MADANTAPATEAKTTARVVSSDVPQKDGTTTNDPGKASAAVEAHAAEGSNMQRQRKLMEGAVEVMGQQFEAAKARKEATTSEKPLAELEGLDAGEQFLANIWGEQVGDKKPQAEGSPDPGGELEGSSPEPETPDDQEPARGQEVQAETGPGVPEELSESYREAMLGMRFSNVPQSVLENLSVEQVIAIGLPMRENQKAANGKVDELASEAGATSAQATSQEAAPVDSAALAERLKGFGEELRDLGVTPEAADALPSAIQSTVEERVQALVGEALQPLLAGREQERRELLRLLESEARNGLVGQYPALSNDGEWAKVRTGLEELGSKGDLAAFGSLSEAAEFVAYTTFGKGAVASAQAETEQKLQRRETARPAATRGPKSSRGMSFDEWQTQVAMAAGEKDHARLEQLRAMRPSA